MTITLSWTLLWVLPAVVLLITIIGAVHSWTKAENKATYVGALTWIFVSIFAAYACIDRV